MTGNLRTYQTVRAAVAGVATAATVLLAAGCASAPPAGPAVSAVPAQAGGTSHSAAAAQDAATLFGSLATPPGAVRLTAAPAGVAALSAKLPPESPADPDLVERTAWWSSTESPDALLASLAARAPLGTSADGSAKAAEADGTTLYTLDFSAPPVAGAISQRLVEASVSALPGGGSALREDVIVTYLPTKPAAETIPVAARLDVTPVLPGGQSAANGASGGPASITDPAVIAEVTSLINGLPAKSAAHVNCPMDNGSGLRLTFLSAAGASLAVVTADASGCRNVTVTIDGAGKPALSGGDQLTNQIMTAIGARWQLSAR